MPRSSRSLAPALLAAEALVVLAAACSGGGSAAAPAPAPTLTLSFTRVPGPGLDAIEVAVDVSGSEATPSLAVDRGSLGPIARTGGDRFVSTLLPMRCAACTTSAVTAGLMP